MDFEKEIELAIKHADRVKQKRELAEIYHANDEPKEKLSFSKKAFIFMITNCVIIEIYALIAMFRFADLSSLSALIVAVIGECISTTSYYAKSCKENTAKGIVYETAMKKLEHELNQDESSVG